MKSPVLFRAILQINDLISLVVYILIDELEYDLKKKLSLLGIEVTREQIRVMTTRVDGDELAKSFAIFDVTRQISTTLGELLKKNLFSASTTVKYYGTYVILTEILAFSQREYIRKIENVYRPAIKKIEEDVKDSIDFADKSIKSAKSEVNKNVLRENIKSNKFTLKVLKQYDKILEKQKKSLERASKITKEQITVAYSTYDTAANSANLISLINETEDSFSKILDMQLPEIIPSLSTANPLPFSPSTVILLPPPVRVLPEFITNEFTLGAAPSNVTSWFIMTSSFTAKPPVITDDQLPSPEDVTAIRPPHLRRQFQSI